MTAQLWPYISGFLKRWLGDRSGLAATEAAFFAPIFILAGLTVFDLGLAGTKRMELDQALRAGAQLSMINVTDEAEVLNATLAALGESTNGTVLSDGKCEPDASCVTVDYGCECGGGTASACNTLCPSSGDIPSAFMNIVASRRHEGMLLPDMNVQTQITVQVR